jgi:hypothetical protein
MRRECECGVERLGRQWPQQRLFERPIVANTVGSVANTAGIIRVIGGRQQRVELLIESTTGIGTQWLRRNRPPSRPTPPFSWLPSGPGWQYQASKP